MDYSNVICVKMTKTLRKQLTDVNDEKCVLVEILNDKTEFTLGFEAWFKEGIEDINVLIKNKEEILMYWPIGYKINPAKKLTKFLEKCKFESITVIIKSAGDWLTMKRQLKSLQDTGKLDVSKNSRKDVMKKPVSPLVKAVPSNPNLKKGKAISNKEQNKNILQRQDLKKKTLDWDGVDGSSDGSEDDIYLAKDKQDSGYDDSGPLRKKKTTAKKRKFTHNLDDSLNAVSNSGKKNQTDKDAARKKLLPAWSPFIVNKESSEDEASDEESDKNLNKKRIESSHLSTEDEESDKDLNKKRIESPHLSTDEEEQIYETKNSTTTSPMIPKVSYDRNPSTSGSNEEYNNFEQSLSNRSNDIAASESTRIASGGLPAGIKRTIPLPASLIKQLPRKKAQELACALVDNLFEKSYLAEHSPTGELPNSLKEAGVKVKPAMDQKYVQYIRDVVNEHCGCQVGIQGKVTRAISDKISSARRSKKQKKSRATTNH